MKVNVHSLIVFCISIILLLIGTGIYFIFRTPIRVFEMIGMSQYKIVTLDTQNPFNYFLIYCLPDALWYMALLLPQIFFFLGKGLFNRLFVVMAIILPFLLEILQHFNIIIGTFDWYDILTYCSTLVLYLLCVKKLFLPLHCKS